MVNDARQTLTDSEIADAIRAGDQSAIAEFVQNNAGWMQRVAARILTDSTLAEDCVQEALISAIEKIESFAGRSSLKTWLHRIVVNAALMKLRTQRRLNEASIDDLLPVFDDNACRIEAPWQEIETPERILERNQAANIVLDAINSLPDAHRIVLLLRDIEELSTKDTAELLDCTENTVKVRLHRARAALKARLEPLLRGEVSS